MKSSIKTYSKFLESSFDSDFNLEGLTKQILQIIRDNKNLIEDIFNKIKDGILLQNGLIVEFIITNLNRIST